MRNGMRKPAMTAALKAVIHLGVFDIFIEDTMTAVEIATKTGAECELVGEDAFQKWCCYN